MTHDRALLLNPNIAAAWHQSGWIRLYQGDPEAAIDRFARAMRLSPHDPDIFDIQTGLGGAHFIAGRYIEALSWAETAVRRQPNFNPALRLLAASSAMTGRQEQAQRAITRLLERDPELHMSKLRELFPLQRLEDYAKWEEGSRPNDRLIKRLQGQSDPSQRSG